MKTVQRLPSRLAQLALCLILALSLLCGTGVAQQQRKTVRVGFFAFDGYHMLSDAGVRSGYGYELVERMAGYTNWKLEFVGYDKSWSEMQEMLASGEIDLLTSAQKTEERLERFDFSTQSIGTSAAILTVKAGNSTYLMNDYQNWSGMRVGMIRGNSRNDSFAQFAMEHGFTYQSVYYNDTDELMEALKESEQIDAVITSNLRAIRDEWILTQFDASPFYVMVRKGNTALLAQVNQALDGLFATETELRSMLMNKYYSPDSGDEIPFTAEERAYIQSLEGTTLTAIINPDRAPYSYVKDGQYTGILYDIAQEIITRCGLSIEFVPFANRAAYIDRLESGDFDLCFDAGYNLKQADERDYRLTAIYLDAPISKLYLKDTRDIKTAALPDRGVIAGVCADILTTQSIAITYYKSTDELISAVVRGKQDMAYLNSSAALYAMQTEVTNRLIAEEAHGLSSRYSVAVDADLDPLLFSVLNKTVSGIWETEIDRISQRYSTYAEQPFSLIGYIYDYPGHILILVATLFIVIGLVVLSLYLDRKRKRDIERLNGEERRSKLLGDALSSAENAVSAKSQFLSRMSHEMRTPLNAIIGFIELAKDADIDEVRTYLHNSNIAARQLLAVINDVLDMSAIESGKLKIAHSSFDFKQSLQAITNIYLPLCQQKGLNYETKLLTSVDEWLVGDQLRVNQILMNLLSNAVKFTTKGHVWLKVSQKDSRDGEVFVRIEVSDTGCGMTEEMQERLFRPFEQESAKTAQRYGGSGLGLSIVKNLVTMMNGAIRVDSRPGEGSTFTVDLPFQKSDIGKQLQTPNGVKNMRVLAVDDNASEREYLSIVLKRIGVRHTCVADCNQALEELDRAVEEDDAYHICLIDWQMPQIDGVETTKRIREKYGNGVVVIVVSAYEQNQANENAKTAGANLFIAKPLFQSTLFDLFMTLTSGHITNTDQESGGAPDLAGHRVLLAEDVEMNRIVAVGLLGKLGVECDCVEDGKQALDMFTSMKPGYYSAILMDIKMPVMNGYEATRAIRSSSHPDAKTVQIIALTADAFNEDIARTLSAGMNAHVSKPIETVALKAALVAAFAVNKKNQESK